MITFLRIMGIAAFVCLTCFTSTKLIKMAQIRGFIRGPVPEAKVITSKAVLTNNYGDVYWLAWNDAAIRIPGRHRINLTQDVWQSFSIGDRIEVLYFPGDPSPYHRTDIFADNGNFAFDGVLLVAWLVGIATLVSFQIRHFLRSRRHDPPPLPSAYSQ